MERRENPFLHIGHLYSPPPLRRALGFPIFEVPLGFLSFDDFLRFGMAKFVEDVLGVMKSDLVALASP